MNFFEAVEFLKEEKERIEREIREKGKIPEELVERELLEELSFLVKVLIKKGMEVF